MSEERTLTGNIKTFSTTILWYRLTIGGEPQNQRSEHYIDLWSHANYRTSGGVEERPQ